MDTARPRLFDPAVPDIALKLGCTLAGTAMAAYVWGPALVSLLADVGINVGRAQSVITAAAPLLLALMLLSVPAGFRIGHRHEGIGPWGGAQLAAEACMCVFGVLLVLTTFWPVLAALRLFAAH